MQGDFKKLTPDAFPRRLREIVDPPEELYVEGSLPSDDYKWLAVVGARKYSPYGKEAVESLIAGLAGQPIVIVSGLALGIDGIAHRAALEAGLKTVAVPGSGLSRDVLYPSSHRALADEIVEAGGCLLSEFEPDFKATPWSFPQRNRVMAGLVDAVLVVEAELKSGTLITSRFATEYNRDVFALPGPIFSATSAGPHMLIRLGATPITSSEDILAAFGLAGAEKVESSLPELSADEKVLWDLLSSPLEKNELIRQSGLPTQTANTALMLLEIKGLTHEFMGEVRRK